MQTAIGADKAQTHWLLLLVKHRRFGHGRNYIIVHCAAPAHCLLSQGLLRAVCTRMLTATHQAGLAQYLDTFAGRRCQCSGQLAQRHEATLCSRAAKALETFSWLLHGPSGCKGWACSPRGKASAGTSLVPSACASEQPTSVLRRINSSTKWAVSTAAAAVLLLRHDSATLWCLAGSVASTALCKVHLVSTVAEPHVLSSHQSNSNVVKSLAFSPAYSRPHSRTAHLFSIKSR